MVIRNASKKIKNIFRDETFKKIVIIFILYKIIILIIRISGQYFIPIEITNRQLVTENIVLNPWTQYDARGFLDIAKNGYNPDFLEIGNYNWYPLYPALIKLFSFVGFELAAFLISNIFSFLAIALLYILIKEEFDKKLAYRSVLSILLFPTAYFLTAMYSESLFLFLSLLSFFAAKKNN